MKWMWNKKLRILAFILSAVLFFEAAPMSIYALAGETMTSQEADSTESSPASDTVFLLGEERSLRTENEKHFRRSDGTMVAMVYDHPVHVFKDNVWKDIDNTLETTWLSLRNREGLLDICLPRTLSRLNPVQVMYKNHTLSFALQEAQLSAGLSVQPEQQTDSPESLLAKLHLQTENVQRETLAKELEDAFTNLNNITSQLRYPQALKDADVEYTLSSNTLKESIVFNDIPSCQT